MDQGYDMLFTWESTLTTPRVPQTSSSLDWDPGSRRHPCSKSEVCAQVSVILRNPAPSTQEKIHVPLATGGGKETSLEVPTSSNSHVSVGRCGGKLAPLYYLPVVGTQSTSVGDGWYGAE